MAHTPEELLRCTTDRKNVTTEAERYTQEELGWPSAKVVALIEDGYGNFLVHVSVIEPAGRDVALYVQWCVMGSKRDWEVTDEFDVSEFDEKGAEIVHCGYCDRKVPRKEIVTGVCLHCHNQGIES